MVVKLRWPWWCSGAAASCRENEAVSNGGPKCGGWMRPRGGSRVAEVQWCSLHLRVDGEGEKMVLRKLAVARGGGCAASAVVAFCSDLAQAWRFEDGGGAARGGDARRGVAAVMEIAGAIRGGVGGDASLQNRGGRKRWWLPWRLMVAARVWGKLGFLFWEMKMMTWQNLIG
ncbi:hypothetical protein DEO72_LG2g1471 [Vigna unguiculata]|uniref:Uncharacterized protein n=1 Tax=Vigna unguiculata TaxID=3917 RepID=A0A4D6KY39_VIGUN|nr:hypothetical protein DEO72_LG2g1471 [Vigna unguiculata]